MHLLHLLLCVGCISLTTVEALDPLTFGSFLKTATYSVATQQSLFQKQGLNVTYSQIPNSTFGYNALLTGQYDVLYGSVDNVLNRRWNLGLPFSIVAQQDLGTDFVFQSVPNITSISQLRGKSIMVDSPISGYSYALQRILSLHGMNTATGDYNLTTVGGGDLRYAALLNGTYNGSEVYATMMTFPFSAYGRALTTPNEPNILANASDYLYPASINCFTTVTNASNSTSGLTRNKIVRFLAAMLEANRLLSDPKNFNMSVAAIQTSLNISQTLAVAEYHAATDPLTGETTQGQAVNGGFEINQRGVSNLIGTRVQFNGWAKNVSSEFNFTDAVIPQAGGVIDMSLRDEAIKYVEAN